jgi:taurine transport system permease protein
MTWRPTILGWASPVLVLGAWEIFARLDVVSHFLLPPLSSALARLWLDVVSGEMTVNIALTLGRALTGFALGAVIGIAIGVSIARIAIMRWFFDPLLSLGLPMPKIAFLPIFVLWFGAFDISNVLMVAFSALFPIAVNASAGMEGIDRVYLWSARSLGAKRRDLFLEIEMPAAMPQIFTGLQITLPIALIVEIVSEMAMGSKGLGGSILTNIRFLDSPGVFAGIIATGAVGSALILSMELIRYRVLVWHAEAQAPAW